LSSILFGWEKRGARKGKPGGKGKKIKGEAKGKGERLNLN